MSQFCPKENQYQTRRCVLAVNHYGDCSLQSKNSASVRQIEKREADLKKLEES